MAVLKAIKTNRHKREDGTSFARLIDSQCLQSVFAIQVEVFGITAFECYRNNSND